MAASSPRCAFLVGCPRSGTTLLQSLLAAHPQVVSFPESKFFVHLFPQPGESRRRQRLGLAMARTRPQFEKFLKEIDQLPLAQWPRLPLARSYTRSFVATLNAVAAAQGKTLWLEKTPEHLQYVPYLERTIPNARFIHILREGTDVVASLYDLSQRYPRFWGRYFPSLDACIDRWLADVARSRAYQHYPRHALVRYADVVADPAAVTDRLLKFLQLPAETGQRPQVAALVRPREAWKAEVGGDIINTAGRKFATVLTPEQQAHVRQRLAASAV